MFANRNWRADRVTVWLLESLLVIGIATSGAHHVVAAPSTSFVAGAAKVDITPRHAIMLNGYAARGDEEVAKVAQRLFARALAIGRDDQGPAVLIAVDNCGVPARVTSAVAKALDATTSIPRDRVVVCATHTHGAPALTGVLPNIAQKEIPADKQKRIDRYTDWLTAKLIEVATAALKNRGTAHLSHGIGEVDFARNRRTGGAPIDHDLNTLRVTSDDGKKTLAVVVNYACHCTTLGPDRFICGDWAGYAAEYIERDHSGAVGLVVIGCGGDQNPNVRGTLEQAQLHGRTIADEVKRLIAAGLRPVHGKLNSSYAEEQLAFGEIPTRAEWAAQAGGQGINGLYPRSMLARLDRDGDLPTHLPYPIQSWTFGNDLAMVFLGGEVVVDYAKRLKREFAQDRLWVTAYSNDVVSYIPSDRVLKEGGYEGGRARIWYAQPAPFAAGLEDQIIARVRKQLPEHFRAFAANESDDETVAAFKAAARKIDLNRTGGIAPRSPRQSLAAMETHRKFRVELVAAEPLVVDPVAIDWGRDGRLWVAEMTDYPMGHNANHYLPGGRSDDQPYVAGGQIRYLEDIDGDGRYDKSTLFLDGIPFPTGVTAWGEGVLVSAAPDVIYAADTNGDGRADVRRKILQGFATGNYQARVNSLSLGLDNWIHGAAGLFGGKLTNQRGDVVDASGRDFRIRFDLSEVEPVSGRTQQGLARDDWGNWFGCRNGTLLTHYPITEHYFRRDSRVIAPPATVDLGRIELFPPAGLVMFGRSGAVGVPTSACGLGIYRDDLLGKQYTGNAFTCEPVNQLVHRSVLAPAGVTFSASRSADEEDREFMISTDNWFRPVQARTGPDGGLYVVDMYRYVIEHPIWIDPSLWPKLDLRAGAGMGRIYRVLPVDCQPRQNPRIDLLGTAQLVSELDTPNGTARDLIHQELLHRQDATAVVDLERLAVSASNEAARVQALCILEGLGGLRGNVIATALADNSPRVRRHAVRLAPTLADTSKQVADALAAVAHDADPQVQIQLAYALGNCGNPTTGETLAELALARGGDPYILAAVMSSVNRTNVRPLLSASLAAGENHPIAKRLLRDLLPVAIALRDPATIQEVVSLVLEPMNGRYSTWQMSSAVRVIDALNQADSEFPATEFGLLLEFARTVVGNDSLDQKRRLAAVALLGRSLEDEDIEAAIACLEKRLIPRSPPQFQHAVIEALGRIGTTRAAAVLVKSIPRLAPAAQGLAFDQLLGRADSTEQLVQAIESKKFNANLLDAARRQRLLSSGDPELRKRASKLYTAASNANRQSVVDRYVAALKDGNAEAGKTVFSKRCANCHRLDGTGHEVGPNLVALTNKSAPVLLTSILDPNRAVDARYANYVAITRDGRAISGILVAQSSNSLTLAQQEGKVVVIERAELDDLRSTGKSAMPEGLEKDISADEMNDLLAYLANTTAGTYRYLGESTPDPGYPDNATKTLLIDGDHGGDRFGNNRWVGFRGDNSGRRLQIVFDIGSEQTVKSVDLTYGVNHRPGGIHAPDSVAIDFSLDNQTFDRPLRFTGLDDTADGLGLYQIARRQANIRVPSQKARFIRLTIRNDAEWTFLSEVGINVLSQ